MKRRFPVLTDVKRALAGLAAVAVGFGDRHAFDPRRHQGVADVVDLERFDYRYDHLHERPQVSVARNDGAAMRCSGARRP